MSIYSPELVSAQEEYLLALKGQETLLKSPFPDLRESAGRMLAASRKRLDTGTSGLPRFPNWKVPGR